MAQNPFLGSIFLFAGNFAPIGYALCQGQLLAINQNTALFSILGTTYGGNGTTTFALPDLRGRVPLGWGQGPGLSNYDLGEETGTETTILNITQMPSHNHLIGVSNAAGTQATPGGGVPALPAMSHPIAEAPAPLGYATTTNAQMLPTTITTTGGNQPFSTLQPVLCINYIIALQGIFPSRS